MSAEVKSNTRVTWWTKGAWASLLHDSEEDALWYQKNRDPSATVEKQTVVTTTVVEEIHPRTKSLDEVYDELRKIPGVMVSGGNDDGR